MKIQVGDEYQDAVGKKRLLGYLQVEELAGVEPFTWIESRSVAFYPLPYDLVKVQTLKGRVSNAWWTGTEWIGLRLSRDSVIRRWKRNYKDSIE